jgi:hypothetical protein
LIDINKSKYTLRIYINHHILDMTCETDLLRIMWGKWARNNSAKNKLNNDENHLNSGDKKDWKSIKRGNLKIVLFKPLGET